MQSVQIEEKCGGTEVRFEPVRTVELWTCSSGSRYRAICEVDLKAPIKLTTPFVCPIAMIEREISSTKTTTARFGMIPKRAVFIEPKSRGERIRTSGLLVPNQAL
jgi:hypothetical protein